MWHYLALFVCTLVSDAIPVFGLPGWTIMVFFWAQFDLEPWLVLAIGVPGSVLGKYVLYIYAPALSHRYINERKNEQIAFVGGKLNQVLAKSWLFVFIHSLTPLSTTVLFTAAGIARVRPRYFLPPYFAAKFLVDAVMVFSGRYAVRNISELLQGVFSVQGIIATTAGLLAVALLFFIDWRTLLEHRRFRLEWKIWR
ncbi:MAG: VTT domain-containing protein [Opitutaceae bacterium]